MYQLEMEEQNRAIGRLDEERLRMFQCDERNMRMETLLPTRKDECLQTYKELKIFQEPVQLISADESKHLRYNKDALDELMKIEHGVNVVAVVGRYRTGKSLLLNRLAKMDGAFKVGDSHSAMTKGIWVFCRPHPTQMSQVLVLLDTEGLDDALKERRREDKWYFVLATLLCNTLVYNLKGILDADAIKKFEFLKEVKSTVTLLESIKGEDYYLDVFFPTFVMAVRDNTLKLEDDQGNPATADQFMELNLKLKRGKTDDVRKYNKPRRLIRRYFKDRKCFVFSQPKFLQHLHEDKSKVFNRDFETEVDRFCDFIFECKLKRMTSGTALNGRMFGSLVKSLVKSIQKDLTPCLHEAAKKMVKGENKHTVKLAVDVYRNELQRLIGPNMPKSSSMLDLHQQSMKTALEYVRKNIVYDDVELFLDKAKTSFLRVLKKLEKRVAKESENKCWETLRRLDTMRIFEKLNLGAYAKVAGYNEYIEDIDWVVEQYRNEKELGPKADTVLQSYLDGKEEEDKRVYEMVKKVQEEEASITEISRTHMTEFSQSFRTGIECRDLETVSDEQSKLALEEQEMKKTHLSENIFTFMKLKMQEYERQLAEGADAALKTKQENEEFEATFLRGHVPTKPNPSTETQEKYSPTSKYSGQCVIL